MTSNVGANPSNVPLADDDSDSIAWLYRNACWVKPALV